MALSSAQQSKIRDYLGWSSRFQNNDDRLNDAMESISNWPDDEARIVSLLAVLADIDTRLTDALNRIKASAVGSITLNAGEISQLRSEGRRAVKRIAALLDVKIIQNAYGGGAAGGPMRIG